MDELEKQLQKFKTMVFWIGLVVIVGANSTGLYGIIYPDRIQSVAEEKIVTKEYLNEYIGNHDQRTMINVEHMVEDHIKSLKAYVDALMDECEMFHKDDQKAMEKIRIKQHEFRILIDQCMERTQ